MDFERGVHANETIRVLQAKRNPPERVQQQFAEEEGGGEEMNCRARTVSAAP